MKRIPKMIKQSVISPIQIFINDSRAVGIVLIICTVFSIMVSNSSEGVGYINFWNMETHLSLGNIHLPHTLLHWINDGLMVLFFLLVGMEIKREVLLGELSSVKKAILPVFAALGGMFFPAILFYVCNIGSPYANGWGIPMATDIAFSLGILSLLGKRVPVSLKIFLTALAIFDDLGAIVAIAVFYTAQINWLFLFIGLALFLMLVIMNKLKVKPLWIYFLIGLLVWLCLLNSGVHATIAGVLVALALPTDRIAELEHKLHDTTQFIILPLFALANTAFLFPIDLMASLNSSLDYGILAGLVLGKPLGITLISYIAVRTGLAKLPLGISWRHIIGMGLLAGIGFTMSIFISMLAFSDEATITTAKVSVLIASLLSGILGFLYLRGINIKEEQKGKMA